jgi:hypothetical protein
VHGLKNRPTEAGDVAKAGIGLVTASKRANAPPQAKPLGVIMPDFRHIFYRCVQDFLAATT